VAAYGSEKFLEVLRKRGYRLDFERPDAVLVAIKPDFTNDEYARMIELVLAGARLVGMHETSTYVKNGRRYPGVGAILKMVSFATGRDYEVVGKPSRPFFEEALRKLRAQGMEGGFEETEIVSDDLIGDLAGAKALGMHTALVLSGKVAGVGEIPADKRTLADRVASDIGVLFSVRTRRTA
jgi:NagD protein